ncbi:MAG: MraY family glycosyltransferase [Planctomycetaceae bacterium]
MLSGILPFVTAFLCSVLAAPLFGRAAVRLGVVDSPDGHRKLHTRPIPLTGGPTLLLSCLVAVGVTLWWIPDLLQSTTNDKWFLSCLFCAGLLVVCLGLIDDRYGMRGRQKLAGQILAAMIMLPSGITIRMVTILGVQISFGDFAPIVTLLVIVGAINALNLIDGVDGLACTTGIVLSLAIAAVTVICGGRPDGLLISLVLAGSLSGFLIYNFPPARMFLGDSGSMLIGLILGAVALKCSIKHYAAATLLMPTAIWAIPLFDVSMAIVRRKLTGRSIYETDRGHLHHCLERKGLSGARLLVITASLCSLTGFAAILASFMDNDLIAAVGILTAFLLLVLTRSFGHTEMNLLSTRLRRLTGSMLRRSVPMQTVLHDEKVHLNGDHNWQKLWETLTAFAERFEMDAVELMVHLPRIGEEYHASWKRKSDTKTHEEWKSEIPLIVQDMRVGHIRVVGAVGEGSICKWMSDLIGGLEAFESELVMLIEDLRRQKLKPLENLSNPGNPGVATLPTEPVLNLAPADHDAYRPRVVLTSTNE